MAVSMNDIVKSNENLPVPAKRDWQILKIPAALVACTVNSVRRLPDLKDPVFDPYYLPERSGAIAAVLYIWSYNFRKFEYAIDPLRKGFSAWLRLLFSFVLFIVAPVAAMVGLCYCTVLVLSHLGGVLGQTMVLTGKIAMLLLCVIGVALLGYLTYCVIMVLMGKPIRLPIPKILDREEKSEKDDELEMEP